MRKPNFFIVGAPRCGTTALYTYLIQHPSIFMSSEKEPHHFCFDLLDESVKHNKGKEDFFLEYKDEKKYLRLFEDAKQEKILGESSTWYLYSQDAAKKIHKFNPSAKILIILREPVNFLQSLQAMLFSSLDEDVKDFETAFKLQAQRKKGKNLPPKTKIPSRLQYSAVADFYPQIKRYYDVFPKSQVKILLFEDLKENPKKFYDDIIAFLGLPYSDFNDFKVVNSNRKIRYPWLKVLKSKPVLFLAGTFLPLKLRVKIKNFIFKFYFKPTERKDLISDSERKMKLEFYDKVVQLDKYVKLNLLKRWGYDKLKK